MSDPEADALAALGYDARWLESGLLTRERLMEQHERLQSGGTQKTGKYRGQALSAWLAGEGAIPDAQLDAFLELTAADPDAKMARSAVADLIRSPRLGLEQFERIARQSPETARKHEALLRRTYLERRLAGGVSDELMQQVIDSRDAAIQTGLVRSPQLTRKQAELLAARGANPTIRQNAQAWVQDKKAWK